MLTSPLTVIPVANVTVVAVAAFTTARLGKTLVVAVTPTTKVGEPAVLAVANCTVPPVMFAVPAIFR
jgi:integral membrane sensor domain MASE1